MPKNTNYFWAQCRCPQYSGNCRRIGRERGWKWNTILLLRLPHSTLDFNQVFYFSSIRVFESKKEAWINSVDSKKIFILIAKNRNDEFNAKFTYYIYILRWAFHHSQKKCFLCGNCRCDDVRLFIVSCDCGIRWMNSVNFFVFVFKSVFGFAKSCPNFVCSDRKFDFGEYFHFENGIFYLAEHWCLALPHRRHLHCPFSSICYFIWKI